VGIDKQSPEQRKLELLESQRQLRHNLPHLYGWKNYPWMREFLECTNRTMFLTAANQIGKSSVQIRKIIDWATNVDQWPRLWPGRTPRVFWYLYPSKQVATAEFDTKWVPDFMPRGPMTDHPIYGWYAHRNSKKEIEYVRFNSGITIYFKTYSQDASDLQSSSVYYVGCDEELPEDLWGEINFRRNAVDGYFSMVFTATLNQETWRKTMEPMPNEEPNFPNAWKKQISLFDCRFFEDGTRSHWSDEKIELTIQMCGSEAEIQKRVYGKFVADGGRKFPAFERGRNTVKPHGIPHTWLHMVAVDIGSGAKSTGKKKKNHPSTISFLAVKPDFTYGVIYQHWRSDRDGHGGEVQDERVTAGDVANQYIALAGHRPITRKFYDYHAVDFRTITDRMGLGFEKADKGQETGETVLNTLFKNKMLGIFDNPECEPIIKEFLSLLKDTDKRNAKDDSVDSVRYVVTKVTWDFSSIQITVPDALPPTDEKLTPCQQADVDREEGRENMFKRESSDDFNNGIQDALNSWSEFEEF
jgi:phage terminase large subunit-like protein